MDKLEILIRWITGTTVLLMYHIPLCAVPLCATVEHLAEGFMEGARQLLLCYSRAVKVCAILISSTNNGTSSSRVKTVGLLNFCRAIATVKEYPYVVFVAHNAAPAEKERFFPFLLVFAFFVGLCVLSSAHIRAHR